MESGNVIGNEAFKSYSRVNHSCCSWDDNSRLAHDSCVHMSDRSLVFGNDGRCSSPDYGCPTAAAESCIRGCEDIET